MHRARARCASRILKTYTSDGKSGVKYKSVMPPKNSVGAEPPVFPSSRSPPAPIFPNGTIATARARTLSLPLAPSLSLSFSRAHSVIPLRRKRIAFFFFSPSSPDNSMQLECAPFSDTPSASSAAAGEISSGGATRMLDRANEITCRLECFTRIEGEANERERPRAFAGVRAN